MKREQMSFTREVGPYKRKIANNISEVKQYIQRYDSPRGRVNAVALDPLTKYSQTIWLKNKKGHFIGRANYEGKTSAKNIVRHGYDKTTVVRDARRYKRVFGRMSV